MYAYLLKYYLENMNYLYYLTTIRLPAKHRPFTYCINTSLSSFLPSFLCSFVPSRSQYSPLPSLAVFILVRRATPLHLLQFFEQQGSCNCYQCIFLLGSCLQPCLSLLFLPSCPLQHPSSLPPLPSSSTLVRQDFVLKKASFHKVSCKIKIVKVKIEAIRKTSQ